MLSQTALIKSILLLASFTKLCGWWLYKVANRLQFTHYFFRVELPFSSRRTQSSPSLFRRHALIANKRVKAKKKSADSMRKGLVIQARNILPNSPEKPGRYADAAITPRQIKKNTIKLEPIKICFLFSSIRLGG